MFTCCVFYTNGCYIYIYIYLYQLDFIVFLRWKALFTVYSVHLCKYAVEAGDCNLFNRHISE